MNKSDEAAANYELERSARNEPKICDETELMRTIVVRQRSYSVPKDVADVHDDLVKVLKELRKYPFMDSFERKKLIEAALAKAQGA